LATRPSTSALRPNQGKRRSASGESPFDNRQEWCGAGVRDDDLGLSAVKAASLSPEAVKAALAFIDEAPTP